MKNWENNNQDAEFVSRHVGPNEAEVNQMLKLLNFQSVDAVIDAAIPKNIRNHASFDLKAPLSEKDALSELAEIMDQNKIYKSYIGMGYHGTLTPTVIQRNILENPGWYTQYTPYQAEIAQGRLEALMNYQTMICDLTGMAIANASLLDEGTAAAEASHMMFDLKNDGTSDTLYIADNCHPQTINVVKTRAEPLGIKVEVQSVNRMTFDKKPFGVILQYPGTDGTIENFEPLIKTAQAQGVLVTMACDILSLCLLKAPGELGADIAVGSTQRFGVPMGFGGPHAAYFATKDEFKRKMPGRIIGLSVDSQGKPAYRMALQTREQHIRRDKATSNICTSQVLLAIMSSMYAVYHGPSGLKRIATKVHTTAKVFAEALKKGGYDVGATPYFDTVKIHTGAKTNELLSKALKAEINLRKLSDEWLTVSMDETTNSQDLTKLLGLFLNGQKIDGAALWDAGQKLNLVPASYLRTSAYMTHPVFNSHHSETKMMRYIRMLERRDLSLAQSMIPLGSCTMKLNAASELYPITWAKVNQLHPFAPADQTAGYQRLFSDLELWLGELTGFDGISLQPNSGAQGEYAGLLVIRKYHEERGESHRNVCLIPSSAHGTNPASAVLAGMSVVVVSCDDQGNIDMTDLKTKAQQHAKDLAALMVTYPSTHGVFEETITEICEVIHKHGGQVYMDGANLNAQIGLCRPGKFGPDVSHMNLHKTFCIPHGGGGPGVGPIGVKSHLKPYLPNHPVVAMGGNQGVGAVSASPWGSASILPISWMYIRMMGVTGLTHATKMAIINANYMAKRLDPHYPVVYKGKSGLVAHECIIDLKGMKKLAGIEVDDVAKRLIDYGFHAPTVSWPVPGTMMIEPTESESKDELDRFCDAMIAIKHEIDEIAKGKYPRDNNVLKHAPHTAEVISGDTWDRPYPRQLAAYPKPWVKENKFWPHVGRIDNAYGDRHLVCSCPPVSAYQ